MSAAGEEQLRLVTDFDELQVGVPVRVKPCPFCISANGHRGIITSFIPMARGICPGGFTRIGNAWVVMPPSCAPGGERDLISRRSVAQGMVYRVVDGLEDPAQYEAELRMEGLRARMRAGGPPPMSRVSFLPERRS